MHLWQQSIKVFCFIFIPFTICGCCKFWNVFVYSLRARVIVIKIKALVIFDSTFWIFLLGEGLECYNYPPINKQHTTTCGNLQSCGNIKQMIYFNGTIYKKDITGCFPTMYCSGICENLRRIAQRLPRYTLLQCRVSEHYFSACFLQKFSYII